MAKIVLEPGLVITYTDLNPMGQPVVLLLHGLGATAESWSFQFPALVESGFRVLAVDMRGFGGSTYPGGNNNPRIMSEGTANFLNHLDTSSIHLIGISMGGAIALQFILDHPSKVDSLILVNTFAKLRPKRFSSWLFYGIRFILIQVLGLANQARFVVNRLLPNPGQKILREELYNQIIQANVIGYRSIMRSFVRFDLTDRLGEIQSPTLVICGENDSVVPPETQFELVEKIPNAQHVLIPNSGHAVIAEKPDEFNQAMLDFLM